MKPTSGSVHVGDPVEDDAVQEERGGVDLHGAAQQAVEDPHVAAGGGAGTALEATLAFLNKSTATGRNVRRRLSNIKS